MASIASSSDDNKRKTAGVKRAKKFSTKVDMTPMVDLGFLLITFFIFTTTMSSPTTMKLIVPKNDKNKMPLKASGALTFVIGKSGAIYYYEGALELNGSNLTKSNLKDIRTVIINKKREMIAKGEQKRYNANDLDKDFMVVIKPLNESNYKSIIDVLDEMSINGVRRYAIVDATIEESKLMNAK